MELIRQLLTEKNVSMQYELCLILLLVLIPALRLKSRKYLALSEGTVFLFFVYLHRALFPFIVSGVWFFIVSGCVCALILLRRDAFLLPLRKISGAAYSFTEKSSRIYGVIIVLILLIQLSRINICVDYDSIRYGLRSDVLLSDDGIAGFFRSIGLVNTVYTYPKGYEVLTLILRLISDDTFGYVQCFNIWVLIAVIFMTGETVSAASGGCFRNWPQFISALTALIPGITNMSVTAKSDLITLLCQLFFIMAAVSYISLENAENTGDDQAKTQGLYTGAGIAALVLSLSFKPTALVFSSVTGLCAILFFAKNKIRVRIDIRGIRAIVLASAYTGIMTLRTFLITGLPFTSVFTGLFTKLGLSLKYPMRAQDIVSTEDAAFSLEKAESYLSRLMHFMFCPAGEDMDHVWIAWGGLVFALMLFLAAALYRRTFFAFNELIGLKSIRGEGKKTGSAVSVKFIYTELAGILIISLISLYMLYQVDGNYFELLYALAVMAGGTAVLTLSESESDMPGKGSRRWITGGGSFGAVFLSAVMVYCTAITSWNGACGFTPPDILNRGYYNHTVEYGLINPLNWDKHTRVVAFAYEPECYKLAGRVESWVDIDGSGGNVYLTDTILNVFKEYLSFADIDYIYADINFLNDTLDERHVRAGVLFRYLLEDGCFTDVVLQENTSGRLFCRIDKERMAEDWEVDAGAERKARTKRQCEYFDSIAGTE